MNSSDSRQGTRFCINPSPSAIYIDSYLFVIATAVLQHSLGVNSSYGTCEAMSTQVMAFAKPWLPQIGSMVPYGDMLQLRGTSLYYIYYIYSPMPHLWLAFKRSGRWITDNTFYPLKDTRQLEEGQTFNAFKGYILPTKTKERQGSTVAQNQELHNDQKLLDYQELHSDQKLLAYERIQDASRYFLDQLKPLFAQLLIAPTNKEIALAWCRVQPPPNPSSLGYSADCAAATEIPSRFLVVSPAQWSTRAVPVMTFAASFQMCVCGLCAPHPESCKAYPGTPSWPSAHTWAALNQTLNGRLLRPSPPGAVCHPSQSTYNTSQCSQVADEWKTYEFHVANPISVMWDKFDNFTCLPDENTPCSPAGYPAYVVNASTAEHVKIGIDFARKYNVRLNVKNTGHDYLGRSNSPGSLSIWTHNLNKITYNKGQYKLNGSGKILQGNSITVGGGSEMWDIYVAADKHHEAIVGGGGKTVGIGGYITGGGHSIFAPKYGLAADNVWEMEIVTPGGDIVVANEDRHQDLFWAMRGGGGSTFGVITSVTLKTHPSPKIMGVAYMMFTDPKESIVFDLITYIVSQIPSLMAQGLSGYNLATKNMTTPIQIPGIPDRIAGFLGSIVLQDVDSPDAVAKIFNPVNETLHERWPDKVQFYTLLTQYDSWLAWFSQNYDTNQAGGSQYLVSRLLDGEALTGNPQKLKSALQAAITPSGTISVFMVGGKGVQEAKPRGGSNAVNPAWRTAYVHALTSEPFGPFNKTAENNAKAILDKEFQPLRDLTPKSGAYINEAFPFEKNFQQTFWGSNYARLLRIKREVDPTDVFWCAPCVGNEKWEVRQDGKLSATAIEENKE
ncbi:CAZyme family AA7 [Trichoderma harzianum]|nr:CAZyme family AA7 [Trichoderma harzianum]